MNDMHLLITNVSMSWECIHALHPYRWTLFILIIRVPAQAHHHRIYFRVLVTNLHPSIVDTRRKVSTHCLDGVVRQVGYKQYQHACQAFWLPLCIYPLGCLVPWNPFHILWQPCLKRCEEKDAVGLLVQQEVVDRDWWQVTYCVKGRTNAGDTNIVEVSRSLKKMANSKPRSGRHMGQVSYSFLITHSLIVERYSLDT